MDNNVLVLAIVDLVGILGFYMLLKKRVEFMGLKNVWKINIPVLLGFVVTSHFNLKALPLLFGIALFMFPLLVVAAYPTEFKKLLEDYTKRSVSKANIEKIISDKSEQEVIDTISNFSRRRIGSSIIIAREDPLYEIEESGTPLGELEITEDMLDLLFQPNKPYSKGAVLIRDNKIIAANCLMPMLRSEQIARAGGGDRHFGMLGVVDSTDAVVVGTSGQTGGITVAGTAPDGRISFSLMLELKEFNLQSGISPQVLKERLHVLVLGKGDTSDLREVQAKHDAPPEPKKNKKEKLTREQKLALREQKRNQE